MYNQAWSDVWQVSTPLNVYMNQKRKLFVRIDSLRLAPNNQDRDKWSLAKFTGLNWLYTYTTLTITLHTCAHTF